MTLRITRVKEGSLRLEGRLVGEWAALLELECHEPLQGGGVALDLADVSFIDRAGIEALQRLGRAGAQVFCRPGPVASVLTALGVDVRLEAERDDARS